MTVRGSRDDVMMNTDAGPQSPAWQPDIAFRASSAGIDRGNERMISELIRHGARSYPTV